MTQADQRVVDIGAIGLDTGIVDSSWEDDARYLEYSKAADPIGSGAISKVPIERFSPSLYSSGPSRIIALDLSDALGVIDGPATSPALCASFIRIVAGETVTTNPRASSELYYVIGGSGASVIAGETIRWQKGDFLTLPAGDETLHGATTTSALYWVTDEPLLRYLGVVPTVPRFRVTKYDGERALEELASVARDPDAGTKSRVSVLLSNVAQSETLTATHTLWAMLGVVPAGSVQRPHRHQSVALDLITRCTEGCFTLLGKDVDETGEIIDPIRVDWEAGGSFVTPPGMWHAHHNESESDANLIPIQDAGLQTYLRSLDIRFISTS